MKTSTSNSGKAKINRAIRQLQNTQVLINSLPKKYYLEKRQTVREIERDIDEILRKIRTNLDQD